MKIKIRIEAGKKMIETIFDDENDDAILKAYIASLVLGLKANQSTKYLNKKILAYRLEKELKK